MTSVIDCVIGMKQAIGDEAAIIFAGAFYQSIALGRSVRTAFEAEKTAIMLEVIREQDVPVLLTRDGVDADQIILARPDPWQAHRKSTGGPDKKPQIFNLPASIGSIFKGREELLERLHGGLRKDSGAKAAPQAIHGLVGIGKTRAAIEYAHRRSDKYSSLLLVRADCAGVLRTNPANLTAPLALDLPQHAAPEEEIRLAVVLRWLDAHSCVPIELPHYGRHTIRNHFGLISEIFSLSADEANSTVYRKARRSGF